MASILGRYTNYNTPIHRIDPRNKIVFMIIFMVGVFINYVHIPSDAPQQIVNYANATNFAFLGIYFIIALTLMLIGKVSFKSIFKSLKAMWFFVIFLLLLNILLPTPGLKPDQIAFMLGSLPVSYDAIFSVSYVVIRLILIIMVTTTVTATTKPMELTFGIEWLLHPLKYIKVPVHEIGMVISLALRFIPTLTEEAQKIMKSQSSRGVDFKNGKLKEKLKGITSLIVPLFMSSFLRSGDLADAMEARGYDPKAKRTRYRMMNWRISDTFVLIGIVVITSLYTTQAILGYNLINLIAGLI